MGLGHLRDCEIVVEPSLEALVVMMIASVPHAATAHSAENQEVRL